jgi:DNA-binding response OmpR family regulator
VKVNRVGQESEMEGVRMNKRTILVVDDDQMVLSIISEYLTEFGYEVLTASDLKGGIEAFRSRIKEIDLVMIDIKIGRESGFELANKLEDEFHFYHYVFLTAFFWEEKTLEELLRRGKPYFEKPLKFEKEVLPFLEEYFRS